jgi:hypothetical protein
VPAAVDHLFRRLRAAVVGMEGEPVFVRQRVLHLHRAFGADEAIGAFALVDAERRPARALDVAVLGRAAVGDDAECLAIPGKPDGDGVRAPLAIDRGQDRGPWLA